MKNTGRSDEKNRTYEWSNYSYDRHAPDSKAACSTTAIRRSYHYVCIGITTPRYYDSTGELKRHRTNVTLFLHDRPSTAWNKCPTIV